MKTKPSFKELAERLVYLLEEKGKAYGNSFEDSGKILELLFPNGVSPDKYKDMLSIVRVLDKLFRVATKKKAFGESPWQDIAGYAFLSLRSDPEENTSNESILALAAQDGPKPSDPS